MVVDSPPGSTMPSSPAISSGRRTGTAVAPQAVEGSQVLADVALQGEDPDGRAAAVTSPVRRAGAEYCVPLAASGGGTLIPTMASPSPRETLAITSGSS